MHQSVLVRFVVAILVIGAGVRIVFWAIQLFFSIYRGELTGPLQRVVAPYARSAQAQKIEAKFGHGDQSKVKRWVGYALEYGFSSALMGFGLLFIGKGLIWMWKLIW